jgi:cold shock protein
VLHAGQRVELDHEPGEQDGYAHRAVRVWPAGEDPVETPADPPSGAYTSTLTLSFDDN